MPKTRLISPGSIPNHKLLKNLQLQDNYISNDGGDEGIRISDDGKVVIGVMPSGTIASSNFEVFNSNVQYSTGTVIQTGTTIVGTGTTFTADMIGGRFIFDDGTDAGVVTGFTNTTVLTVSTNQTVGSSPSDFRSYKIYYPAFNVDVSGNATSLKVGNMTIDNDEIDLGTGGGITIDAGDDITLSADGGNITMDDGTVSIFDFNIDTPSLTIYSDADTDGDRDYFKLSVGSNGSVDIITNDDDGGADAGIDINADGSIRLEADTTELIQLIGKGLYVNCSTKTSSASNDFSLSIQETLNLSSGAGGSDTHFGFKYEQSQGNLAGWDNVYLMYLYGGDAARTFAVRGDGKVGIGVNDPASPLEIFNTASQLKISYDASNYTDISVASDGKLELATTGTDADITLDSASDIFIDSSNRYCFFQESGTSRIEFDYTTGTASNIVKIKAGTNAVNYSTITTTTNGETTIATVDSDGTAGHLTLDADGDIILDADTSAIMNNSVVFERIAETFSDDTLIGSGGTDDTQIDFRATNKIYLTTTGAITNLNLIFPSEGSGNFQLYVLFGGDHTITNYKVYEGDLSAASGNADVLWPGGTKPDNTASGHDVYSFYWDHLRQICLGVASLAFAAPS